MNAPTILLLQSRSKVLCAISILGLAFGLMSAPAAVNVAEWSQRQLIPVSTAGLIKVDLPAATLDAARPQLEDIRILDAAGVERPYLVLKAAPAPGQILNVRSRDVRLESNRTVLTLETGASGPMDAILVDVAATSFLKAAQLEVSSDGKSWTLIADGFPLFRQPDGTSGTAIPLNQQRWAWLRITLDDRRSAPVPVLGARVRLSPVRTVESQPVDIRLVSRDESPGETRLAYNLGAANLTVAELQLEVEDALFNRTVTIHTSVMTDDGVQEELIATGNLQRREESPASASTASRLVIERQVRSREIIVRIRNLDSQPLKIRSTSATRRPVQIVFQSKGAGSYQLLSGNRNCIAPQYDLGYLGDSLKKQITSTATANPGPLEANPAYRIPEALAGLGTTGAPIDIKPWTIHRKITTVAPGIQQLDLDLDVLANARPDFADIRIVTDGKQIPFVLENTSMSRSLSPSVSMVPVKDRLSVSRWSIHLPMERLPITRLVADCSTPVFKREMRVYEEVRDSYGARMNRELGQATWMQSIDRPRPTLALEFFTPPAGNTLILETDNGDNPPIALSNVRCFHPVTRVLFKTAQGQQPELYYGNPDAAFPRYDLSLIAHQMLAADKQKAKLTAAVESAKAGAAAATTKNTWALWAVLGLVVVALLVIIGRLLPKTPEPPSAK